MIYYITQNGGYSLAILGFFKSKKEALDWWEKMEHVSPLVDKDGYHDYYLISVEEKDYLSADTSCYGSGLYVGEYPESSSHLLRKGSYL